MVFRVIFIRMRTDTRFRLHLPVMFCLSGWMLFLILLTYSMTVADSFVIYYQLQLLVVIC